MACAVMLMAAMASAAPPCSVLPYAIDESKIAVGPKHHPLGRPLPATPNFKQPDQCIDTVQFFDQNRNGQADPEEIRVFGAQRHVDCGSCHTESSNTGSPESASVFLRQDASTLCLVCHNL